NGTIRDAGARKADNLSASPPRLCVSAVRKGRRRTVGPAVPWAAIPPRELTSLERPRTMRSVPHRSPFPARLMLLDPSSGVRMRLFSPGSKVSLVVLLLGFLATSAIAPSAV